MRRRQSNSRSRRRGTTLIEMAAVRPAFFLSRFALTELSRACREAGMLNAAARRAARLGVADGVSTGQVERARDILAPSMTIDHVMDHVKDASMLIVRAEVRDADVAPIPPFWIGNATLSAQSVMRHE